ncbi:uncharacterized protein Z519_04541 [Cladophialophora bantiana CBS 173.52]|uniref:Ankyrin repeat protein n=1 Tax=Cladophialophora bantiana (strain ATCC 10958 / CBS 173.52 / CDC B-1940 / NIH 8579) TaxID=1442370 RepID=A0A0D2HUP0_CLAB1|nr:uncharacterized protein Z519_04541 [Cladophialophora bantiana CBS 173.52]KIW94565.1 hypothetical protein Z519_04541 [Cladophialophora bantiana CBS 173.52]
MASQASGEACGNSGSIKHWQALRRAYSSGALNPNRPQGDVHEISSKIQWPNRGDYYHFLECLKRADEKRRNTKPSVAYCQLSQLVVDRQYGSFSLRHCIPVPDVLAGSNWTDTTAEKQKRYYCYLRPAVPTTETRYRSGGKHLQFDLFCTIFYSDEYQSAKQKPGADRLVRDLRNEAIKRSQLENISSRSISALLLRHFGNGICLGKYSSAGGWMPLPLKIHVQVAPGSWKQCLFIVFGDESFFFYPVDVPELREAIVNAWGIRPVSPVSQHLTGVSGTKNQPSRSESPRKERETVETKALSTQRQGDHRGRRQRHSRWALRGPHAGAAGARNLNAPSQQVETSVQASRTSPDDAVVSNPALPIRGRTRRRLRRLDGSRILLPSQVSTSAPPSGGRSGIESFQSEEMDPMSSRAFRHVTTDVSVESDQVHMFIDPIPVTISQRYVQKPTTEITDTEATHDHDLPPHSTAGSILVPVLRLSSHNAKNTGKLSSQPRTGKVYVLMSFQTPRKNLVHKGLEMAVAVIEDRNGLIGSHMIEESFDQWVKVRPVQNLHRALLDADHEAFRLGWAQNNDTRPLGESAISDSSYWYKFSRFVMISTSSRSLPYSHGYGTVNNNPIVYVRTDHEAILDVDSITATSPYPRSRATWSDEVADGSAPECMCGSMRVGGMQHNVENCKLIIKREPGPWEKNPAPEGLQEAVYAETKASTFLTEKSPVNSRHGYINIKSHRFAADTILMASKQVGFWRHNQGPGARISLTCHPPRESSFQGFIDLRLGDRPLRRVAYPFDFSHLHLVDSKTLDLQLKNPKLWSERKLEDFILPFQTPDKEIASILDLDDHGNCSSQKADEIYLLFTSPPFYWDTHVVGSLLHLASLWALRDTVKLLLSRGYDPNAQTSTESLATPLLCATAAEQPQIIQDLLAAGAHPNPLRRPGYWGSCSIPSVFHLLVDWESQSAAIQIAWSVLRAGGDINWKYQESEPKAFSLTPLRYAISEGKAELVEAFLDMGAHFATTTVWSPGQRRVCLLETPSTNVRILESYFRYIQRHDYDLPSDFSATPLGLLLVENDGSDRRSRRGFDDPTEAIFAFESLLKLQPGYEGEALAAIVRHDHLYLAEHVLHNKLRAVESRWKGLSLLHIAVLYGRPKMCSLLLGHGANATAVTTKRQLTCLHLLAMFPRNPKADEAILSSLLPMGIPINAKETVDDLTAFHMAVRNQKTHLLSPFIQAGANIMLPVYDRLGILAEGRYGSLKTVSNRPQCVLDDIHITGEVLWQFVQDSAYPLEFVIVLLEIILPSTAGDSIFYFDSKRTVSLLHVIATVRDKSVFDKLFKAVRDHFSDNSYIHVPDSHGDSPLHYAAAVHKIHNIRTLVSTGADISAMNKLGLAPHELAAWSALYLSGRYMKLTHAGETPVVTQDHSWDQPGQTYGHGRNFREVRTELKAVLNFFKKRGREVSPPLERLVLAWNGADMPKGHQTFSRQGVGKLALHLVPIDAVDLKVIGVDGLEMGGIAANDEGNGKSDGAKGTIKTFYDMSMSISTGDDQFWGSRERNESEFEDESGGEDDEDQEAQSSDNRDDYESTEAEIEDDEEPGPSKWPQHGYLELTPEQQTYLDSFFVDDTPLAVLMGRGRAKSFSL